MEVDEQRVLLSSDGFGRIAIVRGSDGFLWLYEHWRWDAETQNAFNVSPVREVRWADEPYDRAALYAEAKPLPGLFNDIDDAEREARSRHGFAEAVIEP